jgi:hypothetical protein
VGEWLESPIYRLRLIGATPCGKLEDATAAAGADRRKKFRLGVSVEVQAGPNELWVTPKAATLEKKGAVIQAELKPQPSGGCEATLGPQRVAPGQTAIGAFVFELPDESYARSATFAFQPPRWGGAPRFRVQMPDCFGDCAEKKLSKVEQK